MSRFKKVTFIVIFALLATAILPFLNKQNSGFIITASDEIQVTKNADTKSVALGQNYVTWIEKRNGDYNLYSYDFSTKKESQLNTATLSSDVLGPSIYNDKIYLVDHTVDGWVFNEYDIFHSVLRKIKTETREVLSFSVSENNIVYEAKENDNVDVFVLDKQSGITKNITNDSDYQKSPSIFGNLVAWAEFPVTCEASSTTIVPQCDVSKYGKVVTYDLVSNVKTVLFDHIANLSAVKSGNQMLAWSELEGSTNVVKVYYVNVGKLITVSPADYHSYNPELGGDSLLYFVKRAKGDDLELYQFSTGVHQILSWTNAVKNSPSLGVLGNYAAWIDNRFGSNDVYYYDGKESGQNIDQDGDGLTDAEENKLGTSVFSADTDNDGLTDYEEVKIYHTYPTQYDSDGDGIKDGEEVKNWLSNPLKFDSNNDGIDDKTSITQGFNPMADRSKLTVYRTIKYENTVQEKQEADYLKRALNNYLGRGKWVMPSASEWKQITNAYSYGGYNIKEIASYLRGNKQAISFYTIASVWREQQAIDSLASR